MARSATQNQPPRRRFWFLRIVGLLLFVAALGFGWDYAWKQAAKLVDEKTASLIRNSNDAGREIECANRRVEGYPFRVGVFCDRVSLYAVRNGIKLSSGAFRSAAQFYAPGRVVGELDGPLIATAGSNETYTANWESLRASASVGLDGLNRVSLEARQLHLAAREAGNADRYNVRLESGELHLRPTPGEEHANAVDLAFLADRFMFSPAIGLPLPAFAFAGDIRLDGMREELRPGFNLLDHLREKGIAGEIRRAQFIPIEGGSVTVSGNFSVTREGILSASLKVVGSDLPAITRFLARAFPAQEETWQQLQQVAKLLAIPDASGSDARRLTIEIADGAVLIGPFPLVEIPPLF